ncbi:MAG: MOSC domain-containing protein [Mesorhizobium sp.]|nr:MAG: MOSC domain-containing protein [Mesorhizobium sp.]
MQSLEGTMSSADEQLDRDIGSTLELWRYPVSSLTGERMRRAPVSSRGLDLDRAYGLFDEDTNDIVYPSIQKHWNVAPLFAARIVDAGTLQFSRDSESWHDADDPAIAEVMATSFGRRVRACRYGEHLGNKIAASRYELSPIHLLSRQSIEALRRSLPESEIDERRFRPNILVDIPDSGEMPEYSLLGKEFRIGNVRLRGTKPCGRCSFTSLEQQGVPEDRRVLRTLIAQFEKNFGIYCDVLTEGEIEVGDRLNLSWPVPELAPIVIVGGGQAGAMTAKALRDLGSDSPIEIFGDERHAPYERPPLSKSIGSRDDGKVELTSVLPPDEIERLDIRLHLNNRITSIDRANRTVETSDGSRRAYEFLVLATGGSARRLPGIDRGYGHVHSVRTAEDAWHFRQRLARSSRLFVLGGGWLGLEIAAAARTIGCEVTLFARQKRLCAKALPKVVSDFLEARHRAEGVHVRLGVEPRFRETPEGIEAEIGGIIERADTLVVAIGMTANDLLARHAGLSCHDGVDTDQNGATEDPRIFAVGDVARQRGPNAAQGSRIESWHNANEQAARAARAILSKPTDAMPPARFWSTQYDLNLQIAGLPDSSAKPVSSLYGSAPYWEFHGFAVGINRPGDVHRFASRISGPNHSSESLSRLRPTLDDTNSTLEHLCHADELREGQISRFEHTSAGHVSAGLLDGRPFAVHDRCPHADASLSEGFTEGRRIVCPLHFAEFDVETGEAFNAPPGCADLACYTVELQGTELFIRVPRGNAAT